MTVDIETIKQVDGTQRPYLIVGYSNGEYTIFDEKNTLKMGMNIVRITMKQKCLPILLEKC